MPENMYDNEEAAPEEKGERPGERGMDQKNERDESGSTFLVPKEACPEMQPGDLMTCKVKRVLDDQYELQYMHGDEEGEHGDGGEGSQEMASAPEGPPGGQYASMME